VLKAKAALEEGDVESARGTLAKAVGRLETGAPGTRELATAVYYAGVAEAMAGALEGARGFFGRALAIDPTLGSPGSTFPPAAARAFEAAQKERTPRKGHSALTGALVGGAVLGGALIALSRSGGTTNAPSAPTTTTTFTGEIAAGASTQQVPVAVQATGIVTATLTWLETGAQLALELDDANHQPLAVSVPNTPTEATLTVVVSPGSDLLLLFRRDSLPLPANFTLVVTHP
jgi:hypothetical protein